jgi:hypothetical protein
MNWFGGWAILVASIIGAVNLVLVGQYLPAWLGHAGLLVVIPLIVALVAIWLYSMRIVDIPRQE